MKYRNSSDVEYTPDELVALQVEIERDGGAILPEACLGESVTFKKAKGGHASTTRTCHCGNQTMAVLSYEPKVPAAKLAEVRARGGGFIRVCIHCDVLGAWPKFADAVELEEEQDDE